MTRPRTRQRRPATGPSPADQVPPARSLPPPAPHTCTGLAAPTLAIPWPGSRATAAPGHAAPGGGTDWCQIALLYDSLLRLEPSPVVRLYCAVALAESGALPAAMREIEALAGALDGYAQFHAARADLLRRLARRSESDAAFDRAIALAPTSADAAFLRARRSARVTMQADADIVLRDQKKAEQTLGPSPTGRYEDNGQTAPPPSGAK